MDKNQINLYLPKEDIERLDSISSGLGISRSKTIDLLLRLFMQVMGGEEKFEKAVKKKGIKDLVETKMGVQVLGKTKYDYKSLS